MRMNELGKEELKNKLKEWRKTLAMNNVPWMKDDQDAYEQFMGLVGDSEEKPKISQKDVYDFVDKEWKDCGYSPQSIPEGLYPESYEVKGMIIEFLKFKGFHIVAKNNNKEE